MKFTIESSELKSAVDKCAALIQKIYTAIMPECIHIKANTDNIVFSVNNLSEVVRVTAKAKVVEAGETLVEYANLKMLLNVKGTLTVKTTDDKCILADNGKKKGKCNIVPNMDTIVFPDTYAINIEADNLISTVESVELLNVLKYCKDFANTKDTDPQEQKGFLLDTVKRNIVALDGYRLLQYHIEHWKISKETSAIMPPCIADSLKKIIQKDKTSVNIYVDKEYVYVLSENFSYRARLIQGEYMNYQSVIPQTANFEAQIDTDEIMTILKEYKELSKNDKIPMYIMFENEMMYTAIFSRNYHTVDTIESMTGENIPTKEFFIGMDAPYLLDCIQLFKAEHLNPTWKFINALKPCVMTDGNYTVLLMPVRIKDYEAADKIRKMVNE